MILQFLKIFTEYVGIVLCLHKVAGKKLKINCYNLFDFVCYLILIFATEEITFGKFIVYVYWIAYARLRVTDTWKHVLKPFLIMMCTIPMLQILVYTIIGRKMLNLFDVYLTTIIVNVVILILLLVWKKKYIQILVNVVTRFKKAIFIILLLYLLIYLISYFAEYKMIKSYFMDQILVCFLIVALIFILYINSENEKRHKAEELRIYQLYTSTFEDAVATIRMKQHEFDNHINAIRCMQYTIHDSEQLLEEQNKYCDKILQDNKYNKLLKLKTSPILIGFLYSKFTTATAHDIQIEYEIDDVCIEHIAINDLIEVIGILFDNAVDALECQENKEIKVSLLKIDNEFIVLVANRSEWKTNSEIEKFFDYGYSTKGEGHGIGLCRVYALLKKYNADLHVENIGENDMNYLSFKIIFQNK